MTSQIESFKRAYYNPLYENEQFKGRISKWRLLLKPTNHCRFVYLKSAYLFGVQEYSYSDSHYMWGDETGTEVSACYSFPDLTGKWSNDLYP